MFTLFQRVRTNSIKVGNRIRPTLTLVLSTLTLSLTLSLVTGCQMLSSSTQTSPDSTASNSLTAQMPSIDRLGYIAYVEEQGVGAAKISSLYSIRPDGSHRQLIDQLNGYIYAPAWSADGQLLAYSKQSMRQSPQIYIYDKSQQTLKRITSNKGSNLSASFSPNAQKLLYSSTVGGNADIYEVNLNDGSNRQLTTLPSTEVQPSYAPDAQSFVYTSDKSRAGQPRIYRYRFATGTAAPIATSGYAASPQLSLDGTRIAYLNGRQAAIMTLQNGHVMNLADTGLDEPARLSPSGSYALYPMKSGQNRGQKGSYLVITSLANGTAYTISSQTGALVRSPVWGR